MGRVRAGERTLCARKNPALPPVARVETLRARSLSASLTLSPLALGQVTWERVLRKQRDGKSTRRSPRGRLAPKTRFLFDPVIRELYLFSLIFWRPPPRHAFSTLRPERQKKEFHLSIGNVTPRKCSQTYVTPRQGKARAGSEDHRSLERARAKARRRRRRRRRRRGRGRCRPAARVRRTTSW